MKLGMQVGLGPGHIVLDGDPAPSPKGAQPPIFGLYPLRPNACINQDSTWYGGRPRPGATCYLGTPLHLSKKGGGAPKKFSAYVYCGQTAGCTKLGLGPGDFVLDGDPTPPSPKGAEPPKFSAHCMDQDVTWYEARPRPRRLCVRWGPRSPLQKGAEPPNFRPMSIVAKRLDG